MLTNEETEAEGPLSQFFQDVIESLGLDTHPQPLFQLDPHLLPCALR